MARIVGDQVRHDLEITISGPSGSIYTDADTIPSVEVRDGYGVVVGVYDGTTTPAVVHDSTGRYYINITYVSAGEYTIQWAFDVSGNPYTDLEGPFTVFDVTTSATSPSVTVTSSPPPTAPSVPLGGTTQSQYTGGGICFQVGTELGRGDLDIFLTDSNGNTSNAADINFSIYYVDPGPPETEVLIGLPNRQPANPAMGEYYAPLLIPATAALGEYRVRWRFRETSTSSVQEVVQRFGVVADTTAVGTSPYTADEVDMINRFRILLRDNNPDRNYRFRPPEHEADIGAYNQVFGFVWEDYELYEYLLRALDYWNMFPPETEFLNCLDALVQQKPAWRTAIMYGAISHALMALSINWSHEDFDYSIGGISLSVNKAGQYESLKGNAESQFEKATEAKSRTTKIMRGLKQSRYGPGIRSAFGPHVGRGVLSPRNFQ